MGGSVYSFRNRPQQGHRSAMELLCCDVKIRFNFITDPVHFISWGAKVLLRIWAFLGHFTTNNNTKNTIEIHVITTPNLNCCLSSRIKACLDKLLVQTLNFMVEKLNWMLLLKSEQFYGCKLESMRNLIHATLLLVHESNWKSRKKIRIKSSSLGRRIVEFVIETDPSIKHLRFSLRFDIGFLGVRLRNEGCRLLRRWRVTAELCSKFCYGIKTISVFRQVSESSLFPFKRRLQVDRLSGARTRRETDSWSYAWIVRLEDFSFLLAFSIICVSESYSFRCVV
ncbi:hypothetical protein QL285_015109 [Trifolium repens]|nr:hypothetical protein QL285_015109 [Trifolium repens]